MRDEIFPAFYGMWKDVLRSQEFGICPCPEPGESSPHISALQ